MVTPLAKLLLLDNSIDPLNVAIAFGCTEQECWDYIEAVNRELNKYDELRNESAVRQSARDWADALPGKIDVKSKVIAEKLRNAKTEEEKQKYFNHYKVFRGKSQRIPESLIEQAKEYPLKQLVKARHNVALCPFHDDRTESMNIKNNFYYCHACGASGNVIKFVMERDGLTFREAIVKLT